MFTGSTTSPLEQCPAHSGYSHATSKNGQTKEFSKYGLVDGSGEIHLGPVFGVILDIYHNNLKQIIFVGIKATFFPEYFLGFHRYTHSIQMHIQHQTLLTLLC